VRDGDRLELVNQTGLLWQVSEPNGVLQLVDATPKSQIYRIVAGGRKGKFPYLVYLHDGGSGAGAIREFAEGNSAPHVII
jgi:hypothetical protein